MWRSLKINNSNYYFKLSFLENGGASYRLTDLQKMWKGDLEAVEATVKVRNIFLFSRHRLVFDNGKSWNGHTSSLKRTAFPPQWGPSPLFQRFKHTISHISQKYNTRFEFDEDTIKETLQDNNPSFTVLTSNQLNLKYQLELVRSNSRGSWKS